jgi:hypothetical protein
MQQQYSQADGSPIMTIKETAGKVLLYLYQLQRTDPLSMPQRQLAFISKKGTGVAFTSDKKAFAKDLLDLNPNSTDFYNAFIFLVDKGFIVTQERANAHARVFVGAQVTDKGVDVIEGIEGSAEGRKYFEMSFNIKTDSHSTIDRLVKSQLSAILG